MPRVESSVDAGLRVTGVYEAVVDYERARYERRARAAQRSGDRDPDHFFGASDHFLRRLEAGETVTVQRVVVENALWACDPDQSRSSVRLPFHRSVRRLRVSSDDRIVPARDLGPHPDGRVTDEC
jgi:hypothetical protein